MVFLIFLISGFVMLPIIEVNVHENDCGFTFRAIPVARVGCRASVLTEPDSIGACLLRRSSVSDRSHFSNQNLRFVFAFAC